MESNTFLAVDAFIAEQFSRDDPALKAVEKSLADAQIQNISVSSSQGKLLHVLALACGAKRILEIGTLAGYSTIWMARALPRDGRLLSIEYNAEHAQIARTNVERAGLSDVVEVRVGRALEVLPSLQKEKLPPFDMVFIDADKLPYDQYFQWALKLSRPGSLIVADNVVRGGRVLEANSSDDNIKGARRFLKLLAASREVDATVLQTVGAKGHDGLAIAVVKG
ncbi:MAG TPA: O-methyltransferase [bacterium]|nr:O-methyltransferase [bacterium]